MEKLPLSVAVISKDEEKNIGRMIASVSMIASEIIVVDSGSEDKTLQVAKKLGAKIFSEEWKGFADQKNSAMEKCTQPWILFLDCDEIVTPELAGSIRDAILSDQKQAYILKRRTVYLGKILKYAWQPDLNLRLARKSANPRWHGNIHESISIDQPKSILSGWLLHYSYDSVSDHFARTVRYAKLAAESANAKGRKSSLTKILLSPFFALVKTFLLKRAFLDGIPGIIAGISSGVSAFLKYAMLWEMRETKK